MNTINSLTYSKSTIEDIVKDLNSDLNKGLSGEQVKAK